jgi:hypothetical protein
MLISKPEKNTTATTKELQANLLINLDARIFNKILANLIQHHIQKIIHHGQVSS